MYKVLLMKDTCLLGAAIGIEIGLGGFGFGFKFGFGFGFGFRFGFGVGQSIPFNFSVENNARAATLAHATNGFKIASGEILERC